MSARALALVALLGCGPHATSPPLSPAAAGLSLSLYRGEDLAYAVVDDRRWLDITGNQLVLDHIDPGATLASLVIEPLDTHALHVGECTRDYLPARENQPIFKKGDKSVVAGPRILDSVHCSITGAPGRYLVRVLYVSPTLAYRAQHAVEITAADRAAVTTRFAIATPLWHEHADVAIFDGVPGGDQPPREVARGQITLDGSTAVVEVPARQLASSLRRIYDGAVIASETPQADPSWGAESVSQVWVWLEIPRLELAPGPVTVHVDLAGEGVRDIDVPAAGRQQQKDTLRLPLWVDDTLRGERQRFGDLGDAADLAERVLLTVANLGDTPRDVWVVEHVRTSRRHRVERAWPQKPTAVGDRLESKLTVKPGKLERVAYTLAYDF